MLSIIALALGLLSGVQRAAAQASLPALITEQRLHDYLEKYLPLSEAQAAAVQRLHQQYLADWAIEFNEATRELNSKWQAAYTAPDKFTGTDMAKAFRDALEVVEQTRAARKVFNDAFFDSIELLLAESQAAGLQRIRYAHDRRSYEINDLGLRERHLDVVDLVEELELSPEERPLVEAVLVDYEPVFVAERRRAVEVDHRCSLIEFQGIELVRQQQLDGVADPARIEQGNRLGAEFARLGYASQRRLVDVVRRGLQSLKNALSPANAAALQRAYDEQAYWEIFPDPIFAGPYYDQVLATIADLDDDRRAALLAFRQQYEEQHAHLCCEMAKTAYENSQLPFELGVRHQGDEYGQQYMEEVAKAQAANAKDMRDAGLKREELDLRQPTVVRSLLTPEEIARLQPWRWETAPPSRPWARMADIKNPGKGGHRPPAPSEKPKGDRAKLNAATQPTDAGAMPSRP